MNRIRALWNSDQPAVCNWLQIPATIHAEALAGCGWDGIVIDLQHSPIDITKAMDMIVAIEKGGAEPLVRLQSNNAAEIMKLLDLGAYGVIAPMVETQEQAKAFASAIHYPPSGTRSFGPRRPLLRYGAGYLQQASASIVALAMIETRLGLENLEAILAVDGLDGVFIGPADLALALGCEARPDSNDPIVVEAISEIRSRTRMAGKRIGIYCASAGFARAKLDEGFDLVTMAPDLPALISASRSALAEVRG
ncbi:hypothetical protein N185_17650 [Sinorhizobium sp. GW3]|nr:hypothetical protein N185_17650 [Sinorhizobium sp. GW3]